MNRVKILYEIREGLAKRLKHLSITQVYGILDKILAVRHLRILIGDAFKEKQSIGCRL